MRGRRSRHVGESGTVAKAAGGEAECMDIVEGTPLGAEELARIDAYWRAANYLSVGQIYLMGNPLLREPLQPEHVKPRLLGHWGTTPGPEPALRPPQPDHRRPRPGDHLRDRPGPRRPRPGGQHLAGGHLHRGLPGDRPRTRPAWRGCSASSPSPAASPATSRRRRPARSTRAASSATRCRTPTAPRSTTRTWSSPA